MKVCAFVPTWGWRQKPANVLLLEWTLRRAVCAALAKETAMQLIVEQADVDEVRAAALAYGVKLTDTQANNILTCNRNYAGQCFLYGIGDTENRETLGKLLKKMGLLNENPDQV